VSYKFKYYKDMVAFMDEHEHATLLAWDPIYIVFIPIVIQKNR
jgi:hypothetical protein